MNYPTPDPSWDYATVWNEFQKAKSELLSLEDSLMLTEDASPEADINFITTVQSIKDRLCQVLFILKENGKI